MPADTGVPNPENSSGAGSLPPVGSSENRSGSPIAGPASNVTGAVASDAVMVALLDSVGTSHDCGGLITESGSVSGLGASGSSDTVPEALSLGSRKKFSGPGPALWICTRKVCVEPGASVVPALFGSPPLLTPTPELNRMWPR